MVGEEQMNPTSYPTIIDLVSHPFFEFYKAMIVEYKKNWIKKGDSWETCSWSYLIDGVAHQIEDMQNRDDEDFYANIGNYAAMLWVNSKRGLYDSSPTSTTEVEK